MISPFCFLFLSVSLLPFLAFLYFLCRSYTESLARSRAATAPKSSSTARRRAKSSNLVEDAAAETYEPRSGRWINGVLAAIASGSFWMWINIYNCSSGPLCTCSSGYKTPYR